MRALRTFLPAGCLLLALAATCQAGPVIQRGVIPEDTSKTAQENARWCGEQIKRARTLIEERRWGEAREALDKIGAFATQSQTEEMREIYLQIEAEGKKQLRQAKDDYHAGNYVPAIKNLGRISREFGWLPSGKGAAAVVKEAEADPKAQLAIQEGKAAILADAADEIIFRVQRGPQTRLTGASRPASEPAEENAPATAPASQPSVDPQVRIAKIKQLRLERAMRVLEILETIASTYPASPTGQRATADLAALNSDKAFMAAVAKCRQEQEAQRALQRAESYLKAGMNAKALEYYKEVVAKFPGTVEAGRAQAAIETLSHRGKP